MFKSLAQPIQRVHRHRMGTWQVSDLTQELTAMASMLTARDDKVGESPLAQSLTSALKGKLQASKELSVHGLTQFMEACKCSSLPDKVKNDLLQASEQVAMNLSTGPQAGPASRMQHVPQELLNVPSYLSANDWKHLEAVDMHSGVQTLVHRLKTVAVRSLKNNQEGLRSNFGASGDEQGKAFATL